MCVLAGVLCDAFFPNFRYKWAFDETAEKLPRELDFRLEVKNAIRCQEMFKGHDRIKVPKVYEHLTN